METPPDFVPRTDPSDRRRLRISFKTLADSFCSSAERFPVTLAYLLAFSLWAVIDIYDSALFKSSNLLIVNLEPSLWFLTLTGMMLSLAVSLWCEHNTKPSIVKKAQIIANVLLFADFVYLVFNLKNMSQSVWIAHLAIETALVVAVIFVPAVRHTPRRHNLMFSYAQFGNIIGMLIISMAMEIALSIIYLTIEALFGFSSYKFFMCLQVIFAASLSILIFIGRIPTFAETAEMVGNYRPTKFITGLIKYILLPLVAIYMIILYVYGVKIIINGVMPEGVVCYMITALTAAVYLLLFLLNALDSGNTGDDRLTRLSLRIFPLALIPLLVMMSVAIGQRIGQYGMTTSRLYVLTFNIWAYATAIYLFLTRSRNTNIVALTFAVVFLLTSIIPGLNYTSLVNSYMRGKVIDAIVATGVERSQLPLSYSEFEVAKDKMDDKTWKEVKSKLRYLDSDDDHSQISDIVSFAVELSPYTYAPMFDDENVVEAVTTWQYYKFSDSDNVSVPVGFNHVRYLSESSYRPIVYLGDRLSLNISGVFDLSLPVDSIHQLPEDSIHSPLVYAIDRKASPDSLFVVSSLSMMIDDKDSKNKKEVEGIVVNGYLFTK